VSSFGDSTQTYFWLSGDGAAEPAAADGFWSDFAALERKSQASPWLVTTHLFDSDFAHWEMHPEGDEIFFAQSGSFVATLEQDGARADHALKGGETLLIPKGAWHFLKVLEPGRIVVITAGRGTQHRPA
jgi:mannose-6-phosphate isomerase-like protein (cupin superfamily)